MIELHCHTTCSDGTLTPRQLVATALAAGVKALAITDHDTVAGWPEAYEAAQGTGLEIVPGVELSTTEQGQSLHLLGFYPDGDRLQAQLGDRMAGRWQRAKTMVARLEALGLPVTLPPLPPGTAPGRPHVARALVAAGHVASVDEAFDRWLGDGKPAHVPYDRLTGAEGVALLRECGAVVVWAHPFISHGGRLDTLLPELVAAGLQGLEVIHPHHTPRDRRRLEEFCDRYDLIPTGGSDYHGPSPTPKGSQESVPLNGLGVPWAWLQGLKALSLDPRPPGRSS
jgi:3',5'-nucleoside bisphosphate phosphatase